MLTRSRR